MAKSWLKQKIKSFFKKKPKKGDRKAPTKAQSKEQAHAWSALEKKTGKKIITTKPVVRNKDGSVKVDQKSDPGAEVSKKMLKDNEKKRIKLNKVNKDSVPKLKKKIDEVKNLVHGQKRNGKFWNSKTGKWVKTLAGVTAVGGSIYAGSKLMGGGDNPKKKKIDPYEIKPTKPKTTKPKTGNPGKGNEIKAQGNKKAGSGGMDISKTKKSTTTKAKAPKYTGKFIDKKGDVAYDSVGDFFRHMTGKQKEKAVPKGMKQVKSETKGATKGISYSKQKATPKKKSRSNITNSSTYSKNLFKGGKASRYYSGGGTVFTGR